MKERTYYLNSYGAVSFSGETKAGPFYEQILSGRKTLTLRKRRKDGRPHVKSGLLFPMYWKMQYTKIEDKPIHYIGTAECLAYEPVKIVDRWYDEEFAKSDGFEDLDEFRDNWFPEVDVHIPTLRSPGWRNIAWLDDVLESYYSLKKEKLATEIVMNWGRRHGKSTIVKFLELEYMMIKWKFPLVES